MNLNSQCCYLRLPSAGITSVCHYAPLKLISGGWGEDPLAFWWGLYGLLDLVSTDSITILSLPIHGHRCLSLFIQVFLHFFQEYFIIFRYKSYTPLVNSLWYELRASWFLGRHSATWVTSGSLVKYFILSDDTVNWIIKIHPFSLFSLMCFVHLYCCTIFTIIQC
jgi:hypothetical protein